MWIFLPQFLEIRVQTKAAPEAVGDTIPAAKELAENLSGAFEVGQGELTLANAIDMFAAGYTPGLQRQQRGFSLFRDSGPAFHQKPTPTTSFPLFFRWTRTKP